MGILTILKAVLALSIISIMIKMFIVLENNHSLFEDSLSKYREMIPFSKDDKIKLRLVKKLGLVLFALYTALVIVMIFSS